MSQSVPLYQRPKPRLRGRLHEIAFFIAIPAGVVLIVLAPGPVARAGAVVYWLALLSQFGVSASYHLGKWSERAHERMRRLDHSTIFLLIAGDVHAVLSAGAGRDGLAGAAGRRVDRRRRGHPDEALPHRPERALRVPLHRARVGGHLRDALARARADDRGARPAHLGWLAVHGRRARAGHQVAEPFPRTFGFHEIWHSATIAAAACLFAAIVLLCVA